MRDEVKRISKLVAEGKLSPEDAADLIDAFYATDRPGEDGEPVSDHRDEAGGESRDPFRSLVESIERLTKEGAEAVNWSEVSKQAREGAKRGFEAIRLGLEDLSKGKVNLSWLTSSESKEVHLPLTVAAGKQLRIENPSGSVKVLGGFEQGSVTAQAKFRAASLEEAKKKAETYTLVIEESEHLVLIRQPEVSGLHVDLEVHVATGTPVEIRGEAGDLTVVDTKAGVRASNQSGFVHLRGLGGTIDISADSGDVVLEDTQSTTAAIESKSGNITVRHHKGNLNARTASGAVRLVASGGKAIALESVAGDVEVQMDEPVTGGLSVRTVTGNALVAVPDGCDCRVSLSALRGNVVSRIALAEDARTDSRLTGRLGAGTGTIDVSAVTGNITLELVDAAKPV